jgi:hypothetical protein
MRPNPFEGFKISDQDVTGDPKYYGFVNHQGEWYILKEDAAAGTFRYCMGASGYAVAWAARTTQTYVLYSEVI